MECEGVWSRVFKDKSFDERESSKVNVCKWLARGYKEKTFNRSQTGNLITRLRKDYEVYCVEGGEEHLDFILSSESYEEFLKNVPEYTRIRAKFPSRDKQPVEQICFPWSNEKLYGKGINSNVQYIYE